ncbi:ALP1-like protein isoform X1 [Tanacetum coccineum]
MFTRIVRDLSANCPYFQEGCDAVGKASISALVKCTSAIRQLAYAAIPDSLDEYLQIGEKTSRDCLMHFCNGVIELYGEEYLRRPTQTDVEKLYAFHENKHGFPGMIGSIDCTKWPWAQCPQAYRAQFSRGDSGSEPFILLEAVASQDLWIWHAFFGVAGSNNDVNVLRQSPVLNDLKVGKAPEVPFVANDVTYKWGYYLTDGIYPEWAVLMKSISQPGSNDVKRIRYKQAHEAARKDVERAFGVLKKKWAIVRTPARSRSLKRITHLMYTCIILHNMIRKEKGKAISPDFYPEEQHREDDPRLGYPDWYKGKKAKKNNRLAAHVNSGFDEHFSGETTFDMGYENEVGLGQNGHVDQKLVAIVCQEMMKMFRGKGVTKKKGAASSSHAGIVSCFTASFALFCHPNMDLLLDWISDTVASGHMSPNLNLFISTKYLKQPIIMHLPDGTSKTVTIVGQV